MIGCIFYAAGITLFLDPNNLAPGGVAGISIIVGSLTGLPVGVLILLINIPIMALGAWKLGVKFLMSTIFATVVSSFMATAMSNISAVTTDPLLAGVFGGALLALGMGMIFKVGATTGGTDILVLLLKRKYKHMKTPTLFLMMDSLVILISIIVFKNVNVGLYATIAVFTSSKVFDFVLYGGDTVKLVYIISNKEANMCERILDEMEIGFTYINGEGPYTGDSKKIILCAVKKQLYPHLKEVVHEEDPTAFMIVSSASDIYGEGFKDPQVQEL